MSDILPNMIHVKVIGTLSDLNMIESISYMISQYKYRFEFVVFKLHSV